MDTNFYNTIKTYIEMESEVDTTLRESIIKYTDKTYGECYQYIIGEVSKSNRQIYTDDEIFSLAKHYFLEDSKNIRILQNKVSRVVSAPNKKYITPEDKMVEPPIKDRSIDAKSIKSKITVNRTKAKAKTKAKTKVEQDNQLSLF